MASTSFSSLQTSTPSLSTSSVKSMSARETAYSYSDSPLGEAGDERNYAIVRQGVIARARDWIRGNASTFLIDASVFPGNSGGPVLLKPEPVSVPGTKPNNRCGLIGMVSAYIPYREIAVSTQTDRPRMIFEENSGLGVVVPHDLIHETVKSAVDKLQQGQETPRD